MTLKIQTEIDLNDQESLIFLESVERIKENLDLIAKQFYREFFRQHPSIEKLFENTNIENQQFMFQRAMDSIIDALEQPELLYTQLIGLAMRHSNYGVKNEHFQYYRKAFTGTLAIVLAEDFTEEVEHIWSKVIDFILEMFKNLMK